jgi:hypothetical protein
MAPAGPWLRLMPSSPAASVLFDAVVLAMPDAGAERVEKDAAAVFVADALAQPKVISRTAGGAKTLQRERRRCYRPRWRRLGPALRRCSQQAPDFGP